MPMDKRSYPTNWQKVSRTIRRLAHNRCEWCGVQHGAPLPSGRAGKVVLTVAHLGAPLATGDGWYAGNKHDKHDVRRENLAALTFAALATHGYFESEARLTQVEQRQHDLTQRLLRDNEQLIALLQRLLDVLQSNARG